jgi:hypothetical protein
VRCASSWIVVIGNVFGDATVNVSENAVKSRERSGGETPRTSSAGAEARPRQRPHIGGEALAERTTEGSSSSTTPARPAGPPPGASASNPWGNQRSDGTPLTGDALARVKAAAVANAGSGATIVRIETDADGNAAYEAHMVEADGTPVTVYVNKSSEVVSVESR